MPITLKSTQINIKGPDGYIPLDAFAEETTNEKIAAINTAATQKMSAIEEKGAQTLASIPQDYTSLENEVGELKSDITALTSGTVISSDLVVQGYWGATGASITTSTGRISVTPPIKIKAGDTIKYTFNTLEGGIWKKGSSDTNIVAVKPYTSNISGILTFEEETAVYFTFRNGDDSNVTPADYDATITVYRPDLGKLDGIYTDYYNKLNIVWSKATLTAAGQVQTYGNGATSNIISNVDAVEIDKNINAAFFFYKFGNYVGKINSSGQIDKVKGDWGYYTGHVNIGKMMEDNNVNGVRVSLIPPTGVSITAENVVSFGNGMCKFLEGSTVTESVGKTADIVWKRGGLTAAGGSSSDTNGVISGILDNVKNIKLSCNIRCYLFFYKNYTYVGKVNANGGVDKVSGSWGWYYDYVNVANLIDEVGIDANQVQVGLIPQDDTVITDETAQNYGTTNANVQVGYTVFNGDSFVHSINHRGYSYKYPENTISACVASKMMGYKDVESDLRFTYDGVPVMLHDATINRTARNADGTTISSTVNIEDITYSEALEYDFGIWKGAQFAGTKIPTFSELLLVCKQLGLTLYLDIKTTLSDAEATLITSMIKANGMGEHVIYMDASSSNLVKMSAIFPKATLLLGMTTYTQAAAEELVAEIQALKTADNDVLTSYKYANMTSELYSIFSDAGIQGILWTDVGGIIDIPLNKDVYGVFTDMQLFGKEMEKDLFDTYLQPIYF